MKILIKNRENQGIKCRNGSETLTNRSEIKFLIDIVPQNFSELQRSSKIQDFQKFGNVENILRLSRSALSEPVISNNKLYILTDSSVIVFN